MRRTTEVTRFLPDMINASVPDSYTMVPNEVLRSTYLSFKAKGILALLLSNKEGWSSRVGTIQSMAKDGSTSVLSGLDELKENGFLLRLRTRHKDTKRMSNSLWWYTNKRGTFMVAQEQLDHLETNGIEILGLDLNNKMKSEVEAENPYVENPYVVLLNPGILNSGEPPVENLSKIPLDLGEPHVGNQLVVYNILIYKKNNSKNIVRVAVEGLNTPKKKTKQSVPSSKYVRRSKHLASIISSKRNIKITPQKLTEWSTHIRMLIETDQVSESRIDTALDWYEDHIGGKYVPVILCGSTLRRKFLQLEDAVGRHSEKRRTLKVSVEAPDPRLAIRQHFNGKNIQTRGFIEGPYKAARKLLSGEKYSKGALVTNMLDLYDYVNTTQKSNFGEEERKLFSDPIELLGRYVSWIGENSWIRFKDVAMFNQESGVFRKFRRDQASEDGMDRDPLTGKSTLS